METKSKFGFKQFYHPTPHKISVVIDFSVGCLAIVCAFLISAEYIPQVFSDIFSSISNGLLIPVALLAKRMWGSTPPKGKVDVEDVSEIKEEEN